jgi:hypothetical protein
LIYDDQYYAVDLIFELRRLVMSQFVTYLIVVQENMTRMLMVTDVQDIIKRHQAQIITSLKDPDIRLCVLFYF